MMRIRRVRIGSAAKIVGFLYAIIGLISGIGLATILPTLVQSSAELPAELFGRPTTLVLTIGGIVGLPILYWILGAIAGVIMALIYNLAAGWFGGLEIEYD